MLVKDSSPYQYIRLSHVRHLLSDRPIELAIIVTYMENNGNMMGIERESVRIVGGW